MSPAKHFMRGKLIGAVIALMVIAVVGFLATDIARRVQAMRVSPTPSADVADANPGTRIEPVVRLDAPMSGNSYVAEVLQSTGGTDFRASGTRLDFVVDPAASFVMGAASDLRPGAVAQVRGMLDGGHRLHADRIVLLTRVVRVTGRR